MAKGLLPEPQLNQAAIPTQRKPPQAQAQQFGVLVGAGQIPRGSWQTSLSLQHLSVLSNLFCAAKPTQPHVGCGKENKSYQDKLTLLPGAALSTRLGHDSQPAKKKSDLVKKKGKALPRDDGKHSEGQLQLSPEGACPAPALCLDSTQISLLEMGAVDCFRRRFALLMCSQPRSFPENSKYLLRQRRRAHTAPSATGFPGHGPRSPFRPSVPLSPIPVAHSDTEGSIWSAGLWLWAPVRGSGAGPPEPAPLPRPWQCEQGQPSPKQHLQSHFLHDNCT